MWPERHVIFDDHVFWECCVLSLKRSSLLQISYTDDGLEAIVFTAQGDMRQALNNLQSTFNGFKHVNSVNVFKVSITEWWSCYR